MSEFVGTSDEIVFPQCHLCRHYEDGVQCAAFEDRIPIDVYANRFDHREAHPDDNGLQFEAISEDGAAQSEDT